MVNFSFKNSIGTVMKLIMSAKRKICMQLIVCSFLIIYGEAHPKKVCVIGAGRAGLAAIKIIAEQVGKFVPIAFERNSDVGGLWIYTDKTDKDERGLPVHSSIYKNLKTITPKQQMTYPDYQVFKTPDDNPYVPHQIFLEYMRKYADHFGLRKYIQFDTKVTKVTPVKGRCHRDPITWQIESQNLDTNKVDQKVCDAVMVCSGRYSKPNIPQIPGVELFSGRVLHSHAYRKPEEFSGKTVIVWGTGASGTGIARDLSLYAKAVFLSYRQKFFAASKLPANVIVVKNVIKFNGRDFILDDNMKISADALIYCTGYEYDFPFLDDNSGIVRDKYRLFPLYRNFINKEFPSMAFIGLGDNDGRGDKMYSEVRYFLSSLIEEDY